MASRSLSTNSARWPSGPSSSGGTSRRASRSIACWGAQNTRSGALLRYAAGAKVPRHRHEGTEHVYVLIGRQRDERGEYGEGAHVVNPPGSIHTVSSARGCVVFVVWERPNTFLDGTRVTWAGRAALELGFAADRGATRLARRAHEGPLVVQRPFFPEGPDVCHVYLLHPPGGLVGGDELRRRSGRRRAGARAGDDAAATKIYRTDTAPVRQTQSLRVAEGGVLEWLPQEAIVFDGARATLETRIDLAPDARFIGIDAVCFGLPARHAPFVRGRCRQRFELRRAGRPLLLEHGCFDAGGAAAGARWGLGGACVLALAVAAPAPPPDVAAAASRARLSATGVICAGVTVIGDGDALVARYLGRDAERARGFLHDGGGLVRPGLLGRAAHPPRIWAT